MSAREKGAGPKPLDVALGMRMRATRLAKGMSQQALGNAVGISFQQIQKYERAANRLSYSRMVTIANALGMKAETFIGGLDPFGSDSTAEAAPPTELTDLLFENRNVKLIRAYTALAAPVQRRLLSLVAALADMDNEDMPG